MSLSEEIQQNHEKGSPRGGAIMMTSERQQAALSCVSSDPDTFVTQYCPLPLVITPLTQRQRQYFIKHIKHHVVLRISI